MVSGDTRVVEHYLQKRVMGWHQQVLWEWREPPLSEGSFSFQQAEFLVDNLPYILTVLGGFIWMGRRRGIQIFMGKHLEGDGEDSRKEYIDQSKGRPRGKGKALRQRNEASGDWSMSCGELLPNIYQSLEREDCLHAHTKFKHYSRDQIYFSSTRTGDHGGGYVKLWR